MFDLTYVLFCFFVTLLCCIGTTIVTKIVMKDKSIIAEFVQASYRSSAAVLGAAFILNIYGDTGMLPLMIIGAVPLYNVYAVIILTVECPEKGSKAGENISKNIKGNSYKSNYFRYCNRCYFSALKIKFPPMLDNTVNNFAKIHNTFGTFSHRW